MMPLDQRFEQISRGRFVNDWGDHEDEWRCRRERERTSVGPFAFMPDLKPSDARCVKAFVQNTPEGKE